MSALAGPYLRWSAQPAPLRDVAPAVPVVVFLVVSTAMEAEVGAAGPTPMVRVVVLALVVLVLLSLRSTAPRAVWVAALAASVVLPLALQDDVVWFVQLTVAAYSVVVFGEGIRPAVVAVWSVAAALAGQVVLVALGVQRADPAVFALPVVALVYPIGLALVVRRNRLHVRELADRAVELERLRGVAAHEAVLEERGRIARDMHDVVAHHVSGILVQAKAGRRVLVDRDGPTREALDEIVTSATSALQAMRRLVGMLRSTSDEGLVAPRPAVDQLPDLVAAPRPGLVTTLEVTGRPGPLTEDVDLAVYRIVQEALANTVQHGHAARATILLEWAEDLVVTVADDGVGRAGAPDGHGTIGMRERAALCGGELRTADGEGGGCVVTARLPRSPQR